jgi:hypothetical protein
MAKADPHFAWHDPTPNFALGGRDFMSLPWLGGRAGAVPCRLGPADAHLLDGAGGGAVDGEADLVGLDLGALGGDAAGAVEDVASDG